MNPTLLPAAAMAAIVLASNVLVQFPIPLRVGPLDLADVLTFGALSYPFAFLVTDLTNRAHGPAAARRAVFAGFGAAVAASLVVPPLLHAAGVLPHGIEVGRLARIAVASGTAFLLAHLLDVAVFDRLRRRAWWQAPAVSSVTGSTVDTAVFFTLAFAPAFFLLGPDEPFALVATPLFGVLSAEAPRWVSWALGDLAVKLALASLALMPYRLALSRLAPTPSHLAPR